MKPRHASEKPTIRRIPVFLPDSVGLPLAARNGRMMGHFRSGGETTKRTRHIGDFTRWKEHDAYTKALDRLLRDLRVEKV
jgi:hypothetical protein